MKKNIFPFILCLAVFGAQAQTEYHIDQPLGENIKKVRVYSGWNVRLIHDTVNYISIGTPCEYFFSEGNEPQICRQHPDGWLSIWKNTSMPKGTLVEVHYSDTLWRLDVHPGANVTADTLLMYDEKPYGEHGDINVKRGATLRVKELHCNGFLAIVADTAATVRIGTVHARHLQLWSWHEATLMFDSIDARDVKYYRDPTVHGNPWTSDTARHITVKTANRWFTNGLTRLDNTITLAFNTPFVQRYNNPYAPIADIAAIVGLKTNVIPMSQRWGLSLGIDFGIPVTGLQNNVTLSGRTLVLDTVSPGINRQHSLMHFYLGLPVKLHYMPHGEYAKAFFNDLHFGLEPRWIFNQRFYSSLFTSNQVRPYNQHENYWDLGKKVSVYNPLQVRAEIGCRLNPFSNIEFNFYVDLLPTYRKETGMGNIHAFGFQMKF